MLSLRKALRKVFEELVFWTITAPVLFGVALTIAVVFAFVVLISPFYIAYRVLRYGKENWRPELKWHKTPRG